MFELFMWSVTIVALAVVVIVFGCIYGFKAVTKKDKKEETFSEDDKEFVGQLLTGIKLEIGHRIKMYVKDYSISWIKIEDRTYHNASEFQDQEDLTPFEIEELEDTLKTLADIKQEAPAKKSRQRYTVIEPLNVDPIYIYKPKQLVRVTPRMAAFINITENGQLFIDELQVAATDITTANVVQPYRIADERGKGIVNGIHMFQADIVSKRGAWADELDRLNELNDRLAHYNKYRHRIVDKGNGKYHFTPEAMQKPVVQPEPSTDPRALTDANLTDAGL